MRFLLIDKIIELVPGERVLAERTVPENQELFQDHFPGFPVMPGVLLTEMMGQAAAKALDAQRLPRGKALLVKILSASFRDWVRPGTLTRLEATIVANAARYATAECQVLVDGRAVSQAKLMFTFMPVAQFAPDYRDALLDDYLARAAI